MNYYIAYNYRMLNFIKGRPLAKISGGKYNNEILYIDTKNDKDTSKKKICGGCNCKTCSKKCLKKKCCKNCRIFYDDSESSESSDLQFEGDFFEVFNKSTLLPIPSVDERSVDYIAGPSGSGKSTYAAKLATSFKKIYPEKDFFVFSRTDARRDPAFAKLKPIQITIDDSIVDNPVDITNELSGGCLILFDDCNTIQNDAQKKAIDKLMADIMEVGRKLNIWIIITNHLVIPNEKKVARTILNEMQSLTVFPKSGSLQQIRYCLKTYYGLNNKQINEITHVPSRWVTIYKNYPMCVLHEKGAYIL
jgi:hypothetical protein